MSYVHKLINDDEKLIGIARLHWIYVAQGLLWFFALAGSGYLLSWLMNRGLQATMNLTNNPYIPAPFMTLSNGVMLFMLAAGAIIFLFYVVKVLSTQVALTDRRVIHKYGLLFVNVHQIDLEEIRGENIDLGYFGRILGYGEIMLDCRFVGDIRLPAIENPEVFIRALHDRRAHTQDALNLVMGKSNTVNPVNLVPADGNGGGGEPNQPQQPPQPEISPPKPEPEVSPTPPDQIPAPPNEPMPDAPPPLNSQKTAQEKSAQERLPESKKSKNNKDGSTIEKMQPEINRRIEKIKDELINDMSFSQQDEMKAPKSLEQLRREGGEEPAFEPHKTAREAEQSQQAQEKQPQPETSSESANPVLSKEAIAKVVEEITPQIAQEVVKEMAREGLIKPSVTANDDNEIDNTLVKDFDEAAFDKDTRLHANNPRLEHSVH